MDNSWLISLCYQLKGESLNHDDHWTQSINRVIWFVSFISQNGVVYNSMFFPFSLIIPHFVWILNKKTVLNTSSVKEGPCVKIKGHLCVLRAYVYLLRSPLLFQLSWSNCWGKVKYFLLCSNKRAISKGIITGLRKGLNF